jgi:hypothetical protein
LNQFDPTRAKYEVRAGLKAARRLPNLRTSYPVRPKVNAGNSNTNMSENEANILGQAAEGARFEVYATPTNINRKITEANNGRKLEGVRAILKAAKSINAASRTQLEQKINAKQSIIYANLARKNPANTRYKNLANAYAKKAGIAAQEPSASQEMEVNNLNAQLRALQQAGRRG